MDELEWPITGQLLAIYDKTGAYITSVSHLPPEAQWLATGNRHVDSRDGPILGQAWAVYDNIRRIIAAAGCSMSDVVKETIFLRHMRHIAPVERIRRSIFPDPSDAPASAVVQVSDLGRIRETLIEIIVFGSDLPAMRTVAMEAVDRSPDAVVNIDAIAHVR